MDEAAARQVILAEAIETADSEGRLLSAQEREQIDRQARQDALQRGEGNPLSPDQFVHVRAQRVLAAAGVHNAALVALQEPRAWQQWIGWIVPLAALVMGVATDAVGNPHRVDLVSLPLLGIVAWNMVVYLALLAAAVMPRGSARRPLLAGLGRWSDGARALRRRPANVRVQVTARFHARWFQLTQSLHVQRSKRILHLAAAAWALGVILSLLVRGLVVEYRVGWESTFLGPAQVHAILSVLRWPALAVLPFPDFTVADVAQLRFSEGGGAAAGAPWVWMYVALLITVVVLPRLVLAVFAAWRESRLASRIAVDLTDPYYERVVSLLKSARVQLGLLTHRTGDRDALLRVIAREPESLPVLAESGLGDAVRLLDVPVAARLPASTALQAPVGTGWLANLRSALSRSAGTAAAVDPELARARDDCDLILHVLGTADDAAAAEPLLRWLGKPVLAVQVAEGVSGVGDAALKRDSIRFEEFATCWVQEPRLLGAIGRLLPTEKASGWARIAQAWEERNAQRLRQSMMAVAEHLLYAVRQSGEVGGALTVRNLLPAERQAQASARQAAMESIVRRLDASAAELFARLCRLHRVDEAAVGALVDRLQERFEVQQPVHAPQAGLAGAATGAAMGASVDLLAGGLTLGAAAALGAMVGGGAAYIAAAWKNRSTPGGATLVQLSDEMMVALAEAALLRYLAVVHAGRGAVAVDPGWSAHVSAAVQAQKGLLDGYWAGARSQSDPGRLTEPLAREVEGIASSVLARLYAGKR